MPLIPLVYNGIPFPIDTSVFLIYDKSKGCRQSIILYMNLNGKKLFLIGFVVVLLVGIPLTVYLLQKQQETRSRAEKSTNISFTPDSSESAPIQKNIGDAVPLDVMVDPGKNLVSYVKLEIQYDPDKLATASSNAFQANTAVFPQVMEGPIYSPGKISVTLAIGPDPTKAIQIKSKAATVTFKALANTGGTPTRVTYGSNTQSLSIGSGDQASEDVLSSATPATIVIGGSSSLSGTPGESIPTGTPMPTAEISPTTDVPTAAPSPTTAPVPTAATSPTTAPTGGPGGTAQAPVCNSLVVDRSTTGNAPLSITFTANGSAPAGTIGKVTFNFGDGGTSDVTAGGGIGTNSVNVQLAHTYNNPGTYTASAVMTDSNNLVTQANNNCKQTITVQAASTSTGGGTGGGTNPAEPTTAVTSGTPTPTIAATGSTEVAMGLGIGMILLIVGGGLLFFVL